MNPTLYNKLEDVYQSIAWFEEEKKTTLDKLTALKADKVDQELTKNVLNLELSQMQENIRRIREDISVMDKKLENLNKNCNELRISLKRYRNAYNINKIKFEWMQSKIDKLHDELAELDFDTEQFEMGDDVLIYNPSQQAPRYRH